MRASYFCSLKVTKIADTKSSLETRFARITHPSPSSLAFRHENSMTQNLLTYLFQWSFPYDAAISNR